MSFVIVAAFLAGVYFILWPVVKWGSEFVAYVMTAPSGKVNALDYDELDGMYVQVNGEVRVDD